jgi:hypothetical protein
MQVRSQALVQSSRIIITLLLSMLINAPTFAGSISDLSTRSFTNTSYGSDPNTVTVQSASPHDLITIDLTAIQGAQVFRATLDPYQNPPELSAWIAPPAERLEPYIIEDANGTALTLRPPRYLTFDATAVVQSAINTGTLQLRIINPGQGLGSTISLDVLCDRPAPAPVRQVTNTVARWDRGDTMITFTEIDPPHSGSTWTVGQFNAARQNIAPAVAPKRRYRIYRSTVPFVSPDVVASAQLIDEISPLTGWNGGLYAYDPSYGDDDSSEIPMLPVDADTLAAPATGIYVRRHTGGAQSAYYLVSHTVNGAEDFSQLTKGVNTTPRVAEDTGPGMTLRWRHQVVDGLWWYSWVNMDLHDYVRWAAPPDWNHPSSPFNYRLGVPHGPEAVPDPPLSLELHAWGGDLMGWRAWFGYDRGSIFMSANHHYYNSYTAFHEHIADLRPWSEGSVQPFFWARTFDFLFNFAVPEFNIDTDRLYMHGASMSGAAVNMFGMRSGHIFAYIHGLVGNVTPAQDITWEYEQLGGYGRLEWDLPYTNSQLVPYGYPEITLADDYSVWDYFDNVQWLHAHPTRELPYHTFANAPNDGAIGWVPVWNFLQAMIDTKRAHNFHWGQDGHGQGAPFFNRDWRLNDPIPAFANASTDDDIGADPWSFSPDYGQLNTYFRWTLDVPDDGNDAWAIELFLDSSAPSNTATTDLTLRKMPTAFAQPNTAYDWQLSEGGTPIDGGTITSDQYGLLTWTGLELRTTPRTLQLQLQISVCPWDTTGDGNVPDGQVGVDDFFALLQHWGPCPVDPDPCPWDTTGTGDQPDGTVAVADFFALLQNWGPCP